MILLDKEEILWESKNKDLMLTTHRLREMSKNIFGNKIKSILLEDLTSCELRTISQFRFLRKAVIYFLLINGAVYSLNQFLFNAEIIQLLFGEIHIGPNSAQIIFYLSIAVAVVFILLFLFSVKKVFSFSSPSMTIDFQLRWLSFEERESFISKVEAAKFNRRNAS